MSEVVIHLPPISDDQVSHDLVWLTEHLMKTQGAETTGGFLGGEFGYGAEFENDVFMMHPFCWCDRDDCPWCWGCVCPEEAWSYTVNGRAVSHQEWLDAYEPGETANRRGWQKDPALTCDYCRGERESAANFLHKPSGSRVLWYKYIGRSMEVNVRGDWRTILADCVDSLPASASGRA